MNVNKVNFALYLIVIVKLIISDMKNIGIFYGSSTGNTEDAAKYMKDKLGDAAKTHNVSNSTASDLEGYSNLVIGCSTWGFGELQDDFIGFMDELESANLGGKKVALFGFGDQDSYSDTFVDAIGMIYDAIEKKGCEIIGKVPTDGYEYEESVAEKNGEFVGLPLDEENQADMTDERLDNWIEVLKSRFV
jgi:flavodoxin I